VVAPLEPWCMLQSARNLVEARVLGRVRVVDFCMQVGGRRGIIL
jgi:hypothetical protein